MRCSEHWTAATLAALLPVGAHAEPQVTIAGAPETVFDWTTQRCEPEDYPDAHLRAFRRADGTVVAFASDTQNRRFEGASLNALKHLCASSLEGHDNPDPASWDHDRYIVATWTDDGRTVEALVHSEYHADRHPGHCRFTTYTPCWYNVVLAAGSADGGRTFTTGTPPTLVAALPIRQDVEQGRNRGFFNPSNIVRRERFYYFIAGTTGAGAQKPGHCLFRTATPADATSWRAYDGKDFTSKAIDPYRADSAGYIACADVLPALPGSITYHPPSASYLVTMAFGGTPEAPGGSVRYAWSKDLIHWSTPQMLLDTPMLGNSRCPVAYQYAYPSILDPDNPARNFDVIGNRPYLYLTKAKLTGCKVDLDRDLVRIRLRIGAAPKP